MKNIFLLLIVAFVISGCSTLSVNADYDTSYNFANKTKFAVVYNTKEGDNSLTNDRIAEAIEKSLTRKDYIKVSQENADLVFMFHVNIVQMSDVRTDYRVIGYSGYSYGNGWGYGRYGAYGGYNAPVIVPQTSTYRWSEAKLIIDALNPKTKKIVWRGIVKDEISRGSSTTEEKIAYINKVVSKVMKKFIDISKEPRKEKLN